MQKSTLVEAQETAGFFEPDQRACLGGLFNHMFFFSTLGGEGTGGEPEGKLKEEIEKNFTDFSGFKEAFKKSVQSRFLPGWIWLGITDGGKLIITQTNYEDNPLMMGVVDVKCTPIVCLDLWEHAYWEEHDGSTDGSYIEAFWQTVNWAKISKNYDEFNTGNKVAPII